MAKSRSASPAASRSRSLDLSSRTADVTNQEVVASLSKSGQTSVESEVLTPRACLIPRTAPSFERWIPLALLILAICTRFYRIDHPRGIVFDELHFGKFTMWQMNRWFYFDIHPPFAKLTLSFLAYLWGYDQSKCDYEPPAGVSRMYTPDCEFWKLRAIVAAFSVGACVLQYPIARRLGATPAGAALASALEAFNVMHNVEGRLVLLNSQLLFWNNACLLAGLLWFARIAERVTKPMALKERVAWAVAVGFLGGNALSIKHTGLATPGLIGLEAALGLFFLTQPLDIIDLLVYVASLFFTYALWFGFHFWSMTHSHGTLKQEEEFMTPQFQAMLIGSKTYDPSVKWTEGFWKTFFTFNARMVAHSAATTQPHDWGSRPFQWILNQKGVSYWGSTLGGAEDKASIYLFGNPLECWGILATMGIFISMALLAQRTAWYKLGAKPLVDEFQHYYKAGAPALCFLLSGWLINLLPYAAINRTTFA
jgi:dolichyl-phosphate-mannose--protein O-mannosyl transferase